MAFRGNHQVDLEIDLGNSSSQWKKYVGYAVKVDPDQDDKATEIRLCNFSRPHMRAFHCSVSVIVDARSEAIASSFSDLLNFWCNQWWGFFIAFFVWFAIVPLLSEIREDLDITKRDIWNSTIVSFFAVIFVRILLGILCDKYVIVLSSAMWAAVLLR